MRLKIHQWIFDFGAIVLGLGVLSNYLQIIYITNLKTFLETAGPIFAAVATLCGLALGWSSVIETEKDKDTAKNASEKLLHSTLYFVFSSLFAIGALRTGEINSQIPGFFIAIKWILIVFGFYFLLMSMIASYYGISWLSDVMFVRWNRRDNYIEPTETTKQLEDVKANILDSTIKEKEILHRDLNQDEK